MGIDDLREEALGTDGTQEYPPGTAGYYGSPRERSSASRAIAAARCAAIFLLRPLPVARTRPSSEHSTVKTLAVIRPRLGDDPILGKPPATGLGTLLEPGLGVPVTGPGTRLQGPVEDRLDDLPGRRQTTVEIDGADQRFDRRRRGSTASRRRSERVLADPQVEPRSEVDRSRVVGEHPALTRKLLSLASCPSVSPGNRS